MEINSMHNTTKYNRERITPHTTQISHIDAIKHCNDNIITQQ